MSWKTKKQISCRSSRPEVFYKVGVLKISQNPQENTYAGVTRANNAGYP